MSVVEEKAIIQDANKTALKEFEAGPSRAIRQYKLGQVETFEDKDEFLRTLVEQSFSSMKFHRTPESDI